ncbi:MAG: hypothetical protein ACRDJC_14820 [Thermomicrobiales bacterium]
MDRERFDVLTRLFASKQSRRAALGLLLSATLFGPGAHGLAKPDKAKGKGHNKSRGKGHDKGDDHGHGHGHDQDGLCDAARCGTNPETGKRETCCKDGSCSCGGNCCATACFQVGPIEHPDAVFCCTGPKRVICGETKDDETCCEGSCDACDPPGPSGIAGSYRRPR